MRSPVASPRTTASGTTVTAVPSELAAPSSPRAPTLEQRTPLGDRQGGLPEERVLAGQGALRPRAPGRPAGLGFGAALPRGRNVWEDNGDLYEYHVALTETAGVVAATTRAADFTPELKTLVTRILAAAENGDPEGDPAGVYVLPDGKDGRKQVTLGIGFTEDSGSLRDVIRTYVEGGGQFADELRPFIPLIGGTPNLSGNDTFKGLLKRAGRGDPKFADVQREIFQKQYLQPAVDFCEREGLQDPLSLMVVADSYLHSGGILAFLRRRFPERTPKDGGDERTWIKQYVDVRHEWLRTHSRRILRNTIYRTTAWREQIGAGNWALEPPIRMNGISVGEASGPVTVTNPLAISASVGAGGKNRPEDVRAIKARLTELGFGGFDATDNADAGLVRAVQLFQSIVASRQRVAGDGRVDVGGITQRWLESANPPRWQKMPVGDRDGGFFNYDVATQPNDLHDFGTQWLADTISNAGIDYWDAHRLANPGANPILVNDASLPNGHDTPEHSGHETGLSADLRLPNTAGDQDRGVTWRAGDYDRPAMRAMLQAFAKQDLHARTLFNDPVLIGEGLCVAAAGHDNHAHVEVRAPTRQA